MPGTTSQPDDQSAGPAGPGEDLTLTGTSPGVGPARTAESGTGGGGVGGNLSGGPVTNADEGTEAGVGGAGVGLGDLTGGGVKSDHPPAVARRPS